jgi:protein-tyrosine phosphatase
MSEIKDDFFLPIADDTVHKKKKAYCQHVIHKIYGNRAPGRIINSITIGPASEYFYCKEHYDLLINALDSSHFSNGVYLPGSLKNLSDTTTYFDEPRGGDILSLNWADYEGISVSSDGLNRKFWLALQKSMRGKDVAICCLGSHGRSGTIASILIGLELGYDARSAVKFVRRHHCSQAVETFEQEMVVWEILGGRKVTKRIATPAHPLHP